jgi:hypothetical protein
MSVEAVTRQMFLDDVTHSTATTFLGLTLGCARCHDHKFDPLPTKDYYRMQAIFGSTEFAKPGLPFLPSENVAGIGTAKAHMQSLADQAKSRMEELRGKKDPEIFEEFKLYQKHTALYKESLDRFEPKAFAVANGKATEVFVLTSGNIQSPGEKVSPGLLTLPGYPAPGARASWSTGSGSITSAKGSRATRISLGKWAKSRAIRRSWIGWPASSSRAVGA